MAASTEITLHLLNLHLLIWWLVFEDEKGDSSKVFEVASADEVAKDIMFSGCASVRDRFSLPQ